jgi:hypothetical protein
MIASRDHLRHPYARRPVLAVNGVRYAEKQTGRLACFETRRLTIAIF